MLNHYRTAYKEKKYWQNPEKTANTVSNNAYFLYKTDLCFEEMTTYFFANSVMVTEKGLRRPL